MVLNDALKVATMDITEACVPPGLGNGPGDTKDEIDGDRNKRA